MSASSLSTFDVFARQKKLVDDLSVRFLRAALSISHLQRMSGFRPPYRMLRVQGNGFCNRSERRFRPLTVSSDATRFCTRGECRQYGLLTQHRAPLVNGR